MMLTSRSNPRIKHIRSLQQRKARDESGLFLVEGIRHVGDAVQSGAAVDCLCYAPDQLSSAFALDLIRQQEAKGVPCLAVAADTFADLASKENPQGILAVVRQPRLSLEQFSPANFPWVVALVAPQDPGNIGTIMRSLDAVGASGLLLLDQSADPYHPGAVRASMGALFWHPLLRATFAEFRGWAKQHAYTIYGTSAHGSQDYRQAAGYQKPCVLLLGSEQKGLADDQIAACDSLISLPMRGRVTSLNLGVAAGIMLYAMQAAFDQ